jgi:hypothetical protein
MVVGREQLEDSGQIMRWELRACDEDEIRCIGPPDPRAFACFSVPAATTENATGIKLACSKMQGVYPPVRNSNLDHYAMRSLKPDTRRDVTHQLWRIFGGEATKRRFNQQCSLWVVNTALKPELYHPRPVDKTGI